MTVRNIATVDLGASSGRVMLASFHTGSRRITLKEMHRFTNQLVEHDGHHIWDVDNLEQQMRHGLQLIDAAGIELDSIGIDTWGVDFVLIDADGERVGLPVSYRDHRTDGIMAEAVRELGAEWLYGRTGIQLLPFNTLFQLKALSRQRPEWVEKTAHLLLMPDYFHYRLTGELNWEYTNASTTQLLEVHSGDWDRTLLDYAGAPERWFGTPSQPGRALGHWAAPSGRRVPVVSVATHDTASAVVAAPLAGDDCAYLSSGTWSLIGIDSDRPYTHAAARRANMTNEGGIEGRYRVLKNIMGMWLLQCVCRELAVSDIPALVAAAAQQPAFTSLVNPNDARFINPVSMVEEIRRACREQQHPEPQEAAALARCIFDSLALTYRQVARELGELRGAPLQQLHIVGGGSQNDFLNQLCADACGLTVTAGPVEASTLGNIGCQLMALGDVKDAADYRRLLADNFPLRRYTPQTHPDFDTHCRRFEALSHAHEEYSV
ncbi:rhamnulokinase [Nissabacter sp. SGAir0207]|uniref:rhamnulokinase n=1 Tax=Nissabacter sp. SGAir0207 TaxID=2126321 RepID=UPI0010CD2393|nr:rhamnulokinase [Nissabacter sp. SGAir0207]QCR35711.1 rhamnulokinase [Nissabacter sp. SGAir0207]